jgi:hypothetical protein
MSIHKAQELNEQMDKMPSLCAQMSILLKTIFNKNLILYSLRMAL